jgi:glycosyltransferase involved in cell wall biosynthesis
MRILQVIDQVPPFSVQGSAVDCRELSRCLIAAGDAVALFHGSPGRPRRPQRLEQACGNDGVTTVHCIDGADYSRVADWPNPFLCQSFERFLEEWRPDVVHFHHYLSLADDLVGAARRSGAVVVYTLHDYGLICPNGLLLRRDGSLCGKADAAFFQDCCPQAIRSAGGRVPRLRSRLPSLARWRVLADHFPRRLPRQLLRAAVGGAEWMLGPPEQTRVEEKRVFYLRSTARLLEQVDLFLAPSAALRQRFIACGLAPERVLQLRLGIPPFQPVPQRPSADGRLRFGYIGGFQPHDGLAVLIEAFQGLAPRATLHLHGSSAGSPVAAAHFRRHTAMAREGVVPHGPYDPARLPQILADLDALIVPSQWPENGSSTIQMAQLARVPAICGDQGGMAELVRYGIDGLQFRIGDPKDLRRVLLDLIADPKQLAVLGAQAPPVLRSEDQARILRGHFQALLARRR